MAEFKTFATFKLNTVLLAKLKAEATRTDTPMTVILEKALADRLGSPGPREIQKGPIDLIR